MTQKTLSCGSGSRKITIVFLHHTQEGGWLPLVWWPWRWTSMASATTFWFCVLVGMSRVPLHTQSVPMAQSLHGPTCAEISIVRPSEVPNDDDQEFFVTAWCSDLMLIPDEQILVIPEPRALSPAEAALSVLPGLRYLVRIRLVAYQDWTPLGVAGGWCR